MFFLIVLGRNISQSDNQKIVFFYFLFFFKNESTMHFGFLVLEITLRKN